MLNDCASEINARAKKKKGEAGETERKKARAALHPVFVVLVASGTAAVSSVEHGAK